jgi:hypothetical protein
MLALILFGVAFTAFAVWGMAHGSRRKRPGPDNNWRNEDYMAREEDGTFTEGSTYEKSRPGNGLGWPW